MKLRNYTTYAIDQRSESPSQSSHYYRQFNAHILYNKSNLVITSEERFSRRLLKANQLARNLGVKRKQLALSLHLKSN